MECLLLCPSSSTLRDLVLQILSCVLLQLDRLLALKDRSLTRVFNTCNCSRAGMPSVYNLSSVRNAVKWSYKDRKQLWTSNTFSSGLELIKELLSLLYTAAAVLLIFKTWLRRPCQMLILT